MTLWHGRLPAKMDPAAWSFNASLPCDRRLAPQDVRGSLAWAGALCAAGVLREEERARIVAGLEAIAGELAAGSFAFAADDEDIHSAVERRLGELIGPLAGKLHTGRSRNDQVATDLRLWTIEALACLRTELAALQTALVARAERDFDTLMPGYTHLQRAQPLLLSHWWLSFFWPLQRDRERLEQLARRAAVLPLGCGALAGTAFPVDRETLARELGFVAPAPNSLDAVSDRDFAAEFLFCSALIGVHLSRLAEATILFATAEFGFFELPDAYSTGSSLMPQKKNPDVFELVRGKAGTLIGLLGGLLATLKGLPSAYDKDLQEDKPPLFQAADTLLAALPVIGGAIAGIAVRTARLEAALDASMLATDLADLLVRRGLPFREAHAAAGRAARLAAEHGTPLDRLSPADWRALGLEGDFAAAFDPRRSVERRAATGGTAPAAVRRQIDEARRKLA